MVRSFAAAKIQKNQAERFFLAKCPYFVYIIIGSGPKNGPVMITDLFQICYVHSGIVVLWVQIATKRIGRKPG